MILIIGGKYNGKLSYALKKYKLSSDDVSDCKNSKIDFTKKIIYNFEYYILNKVKENEIFPDYLYSITNSFENKIVISTDISAGIVPMDQLERKWREALGRSLSYFSNNSSETIRVFFGIPTKLK